MFEVVTEFPHEMMYKPEGPFVSLYQPTHRFGPEKKQDQLVFKGLVKRAGELLKADYPDADHDAFMKPLQALQNERDFWVKTLEGMAVLVSQKECIVYRVPRPLKERVIVADRLHINPLIRVYQSADQYQMLGLNRQKFALYEGNRYGIRKMELDPDTPQTRDEVLGDERTERYLSQASAGGAGGVAKQFGHGSKKDEESKDTEKFFRFVDKYVHDYFSKPSQLPLILVGLKEYHGPFRKLSSNPYLMEEGIGADFEAVDNEELRKKIWAVLEPSYIAKTKELSDAFHKAKANGKGSEIIEEVAEASIQNRVATLLVDHDMTVGGKVNFSTGEVQFGKDNNPLVNDVLGEVAEIVFKNKGEVVVLPHERMPSGTGVAAVFR